MSARPVNPTWMVWYSGILSIILFGSIAATGQTRFRIGPIKWTVDSLQSLSVPMTGGDILFGTYGFPPDSNVWVIDTKWGTTFGKVPGQSRMSLDVVSSPEGSICMTTVISPDVDTKPTTRLYRVADMQLLHVWDEAALAMAMSATLQRALLLANKVPYGVPAFRLRDLTTGDDIQSIPDVELNGWLATAFIDEWHRRVYLNQREQGKYMVTELDAMTGELLRRWESPAWGAMCRLKGSNRLFLASEMDSHPTFGRPAIVYALDLDSSTWNVVVRCPDEVVDTCDCMSRGGAPSGFWSMNTEGTEAYLSSMLSSDGRRIILRRFMDQGRVVSDCMMNEALPWSWPYYTQFACDVKNRNLYYVMPGSSEGWKPLYCRSLEATTGIEYSEKQRLPNLIVTGDELLIDIPSGGKGQGTVVIVDLSGRVVKQGTFMEGEEMLNLPVADIATGSYFCRLDIGTVHTVRQFMIVRK